VHLAQGIDAVSEVLGNRALQLKEREDRVVIDERESAFREDVNAQEQKFRTLLGENATSEALQSQGQALDDLKNQALDGLDVRQAELITPMLNRIVDQAKKQGQDHWHSELVKRETAAAIAKLEMDVRSAVEHRNDNAALADDMERYEANFNDHAQKQGWPSEVKDKKWAEAVYLFHASVVQGLMGEDNARALEYFEANEDSMSAFADKTASLRKTLERLNLEDRAEKQVIEWKNEGLDYAEISGKIDQEDDVQYRKHLTFYSDNRQARQDRIEVAQQRERLQDSYNKIIQSWDPKDINVLLPAREREWLLKIIEDHDKGKGPTIEESKRNLAAINQWRGEDSVEFAGTDLILHFGDKLNGTDMNTAISWQHAANDALTGGKAAKAQLDTLNWAAQKSRELANHAFPAEERNSAEYGDYLAQAQEMLLELPVEEQHQYASLARIAAFLTPQARVRVRVGEEIGGGTRVVNMATALQKDWQIIGYKKCKPEWLPNSAIHYAEDVELEVEDENGRKSIIVRDGFFDIRNNEFWEWDGSQHHVGVALTDAQLKKLRAARLANPRTPDQPERPFIPPRAPIR
jgi:hypothetical protein